MKLGFYYHIPLHSSDMGLKIPAYLGVFIDSLASEVDTLALFMHEASQQETLHCDYILKGKNIQFITLGIKSAAWDRFLWPRKSLSKIKDQVATCDKILVRAPSPLAPAFYDEFRKLTKIAYLVVGDYVDGVKHSNQPWWRKIPISILSKRNDRQLSSVLTKSLTLVNSTALYNKYSTKVRKLYEVKTTTLTESDIFIREDTCQNNEIKLLFAGGFSFAKGLRELIEAFSIIREEYNNVSLHFVGWEYDNEKPVESYLKNKALELGLSEHIIFHGFKTVGAELNTMYRMADIYVIPSYHEGFPRTIWEAMANGLPVIATRVGSIPHFLNDGKDALLIEPKNVDELVTSISKVLTQTDLRRKLIANGALLAKENTLEIQTKRLISIVKSDS